MLFAGGSFFDWFPLRGLASDNWAQLPWSAEDRRLFLAPGAADHLDGARRLRHHDAADQELVPGRNPQAIRADRARQRLHERQVLYGHVFRNAMLIVIAGFPGAFVHAFFSGSLLIETIFSLDGLGLLGFESVLNRDYPVVFATLYIFSLIGLVVNLISDLTYTWSIRASISRRGRCEVDDRAGDRGLRTTTAVDAPAGMPCRRAAPLHAVAAQPAALAELQGQPARLLVAVAVPGVVRRLVVRRVHRQRQAVLHRSTADRISRRSSTYPETAFGGDFETAADYRDPYLQKLIAEKGGIDAVAADPLFLQHASTSICRRRRRPSRPGC